MIINIMYHRLSLICPISYQKIIEDRPGIEQLDHVIIFIFFAGLKYE